MAPQAAAGLELNAGARSLALGTHGTHSHLGFLGVTVMVFEVGSGQRLCGTKKPWVLDLPVPGNAWVASKVTWLLVCPFSPESEAKKTCWSKSCGAVG